jgi:hypothetical protein
MAKAAKEDNGVVDVSQDNGKGDDSDFSVRNEKQLPAKVGVTLHSGTRILGGALGKGAPELISLLSVSVAELGDVGL